MGNEFAKSNPAMDEAIGNCTNAEEIRELSKRLLESQGLIQRSRDDANYGARVIGTQAEPTSASSLPVAPQLAATCIRFIYPSGNSRFELHGTSEADLDQQEARIRQMYGGQR